MPRLAFCAQEGCRWHGYGWTVEDAGPYDGQWHDPPGPQRIKRGGKWYCQQCGELTNGKAKRFGRRGGARCAAHAAGQLEAIA